MKIINVEQGTTAWLKARAGHPTASNYKRVITQTGKLSSGHITYANELATEKLMVELEENYQSHDMDRGSEFESVAIDLYQEWTLNTVDSVGFCIDRKIGYSPDGFIGDDGLIEVKCPRAYNHFNNLVQNTIPLEYYPQVQGGLMVTGRKWCDFVTFNPYIQAHLKLFIFRVEPDIPYQKLLRSYLEKTILLRDELYNKFKI